MRNFLPPAVDQAMEWVESFVGSEAELVKATLWDYLIAQAAEIAELRKGANCSVYGSEDPCVYAEQLEAYEAVMDMLDAVGGMPSGVRLAYDQAKRVRQK